MSSVHGIAMDMYIFTLASYLFGGLLTLYYSDKYERGYNVKLWALQIFIVFLGFIIFRSELIIGYETIALIIKEYVKSPEMEKTIGLFFMVILMFIVFIYVSIIKTWANNHKILEFIRFAFYHKKRR